MSNYCSNKSPKLRAARTGSTSTYATPDLDAEVARLTQLGATVITDEPLLEHDWLWHVLADPEGNEFCVLQPPGDFPWPSPPSED